MTQIRVFPVTVLALGALALSSGAAPARAQLRQEVSVTNLRFVGQTEAGRSVASTLTLDDIALLVAAREPTTLNALISGGIPVRSSRLQQLMDWGLLTQVDMSFQSYLPVLAGERLRAFDAVLDRAFPFIADDVTAAITSIHDRVWRHPGVPALPALTAWLLRERAWDQLSGPDGLDVRAFIREQREHHPSRGFWGLLWYSEEPTELPWVCYESQRDDYGLQVCWDRDEQADPFTGPDGAAQLQRFLDKLEDDGRRLDDPHQFPSLVEVGLIEARGQVRALARRYRMSDMDGIARALEQAAADIATSMLSRLPRQELSEALGGAPWQLTATLAYQRLVPRLVEEMAARGLPVTAGAPDPMWQVPMAELPEATPEDGERELPVTMETDSAAVGVTDGGVPFPRYSLVIWRDPPRYTFLELPW